MSTSPRKPARRAPVAAMPESALLQMALAHISQGVIVFDAQQRVSGFNPQASGLLDLPEALLAQHPTVQELTQLQTQRGDFGTHGAWLEAALQAHILAAARGAPDMNAQRYQRITATGRTLDVRTEKLPDGGLVRVFTDITEQVLAHAEHLKLSDLTREMQIIAQMGAWEIDRNVGQLIWTEGTYRIFDTMPEAFTPTDTSTRALFTDAAWEMVRASYNDKTNQPKQHRFELEMRTLTGRPIWVLSLGNTVWKGGRAVRRTAIVQDITERKHNEAALRASEARWKLALESSGDGLWDMDLVTGNEYWSPTLSRMYGFAPDELSHETAELDNIVHPDDLAQMRLDVQAHCIGITERYRNEHRVRCKNGSWKWVLSRGMVISRDTEGKALRVIGTHTDITDRKLAESMIWHQAHFDSLTELPNRRMMRERLAQELKKCRRDNHKLAVLFIDLDHFKEVNDTLGHDQGDKLLAEAGRRIAACLREVDTVARMGGDEFTVILTELQAEDHLEGILHKLLTTLSRTFQLGTEQVFASASIGVTVYPNDGADIEDLLKNADQALYVAKGAGRNRYSFFTPALQEAIQRRAQLTHDLRLALAEQQFWLVFQPIVELATGAIHKAEALVRWQHPTRGLISPAEFIPVAESCGLIVPLGEWVFQQAADQVQAWQQTLHPQFQISVNKSPVQFENPDPQHRPWIEQLRQRGLTGGSIVVEITEGLLLSTSNAVIEQLLSMGDDGIQVSLDDFGTGYSSLAYLQKFDIDFVKIDQSFVRQLVAGSTDLALCQAIIAMAHALGMKVIAEGVETEQQRGLLAQAGCDFGQGYLFSKPVPADEFAQLHTRFTTHTAALNRSI